MTMVARNQVPPFNAQHLEANSRILGDTDNGVTGSEIEFFHARRNRLNPLLSLRGLTIGEDGEFRRADAARTVDQALEQANRLHAALVQRAVHPDVLRFCNAEILPQNYFHAVFEAMKSLTAKIRSLSGLSNDGADLVHDAFGQRYGPTLLAINPLLTETQKGEQNGLVNLLKGLYGTIRNPLAHDSKVEWDMTEQDALDILTMISLVHRKLAAGDVGLIPWVPLSKFKSTPESMIRQCRARIDQVTSHDEHENLLAVTQVLTSLRYDDPKLFEILGGQKAMIESPLFQELKAEWTQETARETTIRNLMRFLVGRFGAKAKALETEMKAINDEARLDGLVEHAATCRTLGSFRKQLGL
jgi:uncharacterized protein (TIGR02391 family)